MFTYMFRDEVWQGTASGFFQISKRLRVSYDVKQRRITDFTFDGEPVADEKLYKVGMQQFHYRSFQKYFNFPVSEIEDNRPVKVVATSARVVIEERLSECQNIDKATDGRITIIK